MLKPILKGILFDLVGVLLEFCGPEKISELTRGRVGVDLFSRFWNESEYALDFSKGICSPKEFARGAIDYFELEIGPEEFLENYQSWYVGPYPGAISLVRELKNRFKVGCLSNINEIYTSRFIQELQLNQIMNDCIFSNEVRMVKPDLEIFYLAARRINLEMGQILFFDDSQTNVDAAIESGMQARRVDGPREVQKVLTEFGIW
ncbi:MAG: HAD-IA family hydrolase [Desulfobacteraceae bacterium]|nr:HAD-IA family hydrolase [Desulfobacteraceae bacterium]